jgi:hypothetical protein
MGNTLLVDATNGADVTGAVNGPPFASVNAAIDYINTNSLTGVTIWVMPGTYNLSAGITIPATCAIRGLNTQTVFLQMLNVVSATTLVTMGENTRLEDVNLKLTSATAVDLVGIRFPGQTAQTAKLRTAVLTVDNHTVAANTTTNVYGIYANGTNSVGNAVFSFNCLKGSTVNVISNGGGKKRGIYQDSASQLSTRDMNIYVADPVSTLSAGSYVASETTNANALAQFRSTTLRGAPPPVGAAYTGSDILQTSPVAALGGTGIQMGPGSDLVTKTAGAKPFTTFVYPTTLIYGLNGNVQNGTQHLWPGVQSSSDSTETFYRFQQNAIVQGMSVNCRTAPGVGTTVTITVKKSTTGVAGSGVATTMTLSLSGATKQSTKLDTSVDFKAGEYLSVEVVSNNGVNGIDMTVEVDAF